jgi:hypothetical protein
LPGTNSQAFYKNEYIAAVKSFIGLAPAPKTIFVTKIKVFEIL